MALSPGWVPGGHTLKCGDSDVHGILRTHKELYKLFRNVPSQALWLTPIIPSLRELEQEDQHELKASLGYMVYYMPAQLLSKILSQKQNKMKAKTKRQRERNKASLRDQKHLSLVCCHHELSILWRADTVGTDPAYSMC